MPVKIILALSVLIFPLQSAISAPRAASWSVEHTPGSSLFEFKTTEYIVLPEHSGEALQAAAVDLQNIIERRYAITPEVIMPSSTHTPGKSIHLTVAPHGAPRFDGYRIEASARSLTIKSRTEEGLVNGIYGLSSDTLGARWYWPQELGLELVGEAPRRFHRRFWQEKPAFVMRRLYPSNHEYGRRNRLSNRYQFNHALSKTFSKELFDSEPEVFSMVGGKRQRPRGSRGTDPQPNLINPRTAEIAAQAALRSFSENPELESFSLSINDNVLFDESEATRSIVEPLTYFRDRPNYTDLVFHFNNAVAEKVFADGSLKKTAEGYPRYLTALAYYWSEQSPTFRIHPQIMPILTSDRAQWHDPIYRAEDRALIERWSRSGAKQLATWDYYFGAPYPYPRQFNQWIIESIPFLHENRVVAFFSQLPTAWGFDGSKAWLATQLLWDPSKDAYALLHEYYTEFFGEAGPAIRSFYELAETQRNANEGEAMWIKFYRNEAGIELFDETVLREMRQRLNNASVAVKDDERRLKRVNIVADAFQFTETYAAFHFARNRLVNQAFKALNGEPAPANEIISNMEAFKTNRRTFKDTATSLLKNPFHNRLKSFMTVTQSNPLPIAISALALAPDADVSMLETENEKNLFRAARAALKDPSSLHPQIKNSRLLAKPEGWTPANFLKPTVPIIDDWFYTFWPAEHLSLETAGLVSSEPGGLLIRGADSAKAFTEVRAVSGFNYILEFEIEYSNSPDNRTLLFLEWKDRFGKKVSREFPLTLPTKSTQKPTLFRMPLKVPSRADKLHIAFDISRQYEGDFLKIHRVDFGLVLD